MLRKPSLIPAPGNCNAMKYGLFTCPYQRLPLEKAFSDAARFGYDYIELWGGRPHAYAPDLLAGELKDVLRLIDLYEIPVEIYTPEHNAYPFNYMLGSERQWKASMDYLSASLRCGKALGAEYTLISVGHSGYASSEQRRERLLRSLRQLSEEAERLGHRIVLESLTPMESDSCSTPEELLEVLRGVGSSVLRGMVDVVVPFVMGRNPIEDVLTLGPHMAHLHLTDSDGLTETHLLPGDGVMDLASLLAGFKDVSYNGRATLELVTHYIDTPSMAAEAAIRRIKQLETQQPHT